MIDAEELLRLSLEATRTGRHDVALDCLKRAVTNRHIQATQFSAYTGHCAAVMSLSCEGQSWLDLAALARLRGRLVGASLGARNDWPSSVRQ